MVKDYRFIGIAPEVDLKERGSALLNKRTEPFTFDDMRGYKVFTALLTQSGVDNELFLSEGPLTIGVTYLITDSGDIDFDFTNVGAPNNNPDTLFVATGTTPKLWINGSLAYNTGAPVATVLENTIGNVWFTYNGVGIYYVNSNELFISNKTYQSPVNYTLPNDITEGYNFMVQDENICSFIVLQDSTFQDNALVNTPIEIRVYN